MCVSKMKNEDFEKMQPAISLGETLIFIFGGYGTEDRDRALLRRESLETFEKEILIKKCFDIYYEGKWDNMFDTINIAQITLNVFLSHPKATDSGKRLHDTLKIRSIEDNSRQPLLYLYSDIQH